MGMDHLHARFANTGNIICTHEELEDINVIYSYLGR